MTRRNSSRTITETGTLSAEYIKEALQAFIPEAPEDAEIVLRFRVPAGGDYSGMALDLDDDMLEYSVTWTEDD
jgi:hypothetical protein